MRCLGHDVTAAAVGREPRPDRGRCGQLDRLPVDAAAGSGRRDQHRRRRAGRTCPPGPEHGDGRPQLGCRAVRRRDQEGQRRSGSIRQRGARRTPRERNMGTAVRQMAADPSRYVAWAAAPEVLGLTMNADIESLSADLVELDGHPGLEHVRRYPPTGVTAQQWSVVEPILAQLWVDVASATEPTRIRGQILRAKNFLDAVDAINSTVAKGLAPLLKRLDDAGTAVPQQVT